jgi:hypothetical protein
MSPKELAEKLQNDMQRAGQVCMVVEYVLESFGHMNGFSDDDWAEFANWWDGEN